MISYKKISSKRAHHFFDSLLPETREIEEGPEALVFTPLVANQFNSRVQIIIQSLNSGSIEQIEQNIRSLIELSRFKPRDSVVSLFLKYNLIDIVMNFKETQFKPLLYELFANLSASKAFTIPLIQKGLLNFFLRDFFSIDERFNNYIIIIVCNIVSNSFFARALLYSTNFFENAYGILESEHPIFYDEWTSKLLYVYCNHGPTYGQTDVDVDPNASEQLSIFLNEYTFDDNFDINLFADFCTYGIVLDKEGPFWNFIIYFLKYSESDVAFVSIVKCLRVLLERDVNMPEPKLSYDLLESRIPFFDFVQRVVDKGSVPTEVFSGILKIFTRIYSVDINPNDISIKERSKEAIEFIMTLFDSEDSPFIKDIAHSLSNIISTFGDLAQIVIDKSIGSIRWLMANANFATRSAITWLFLTLMANEQSFVLIDDIEMVIAIAESQRQTDFVKHVIKSFEYVFDIQERDPKREGRSIENYFEECDGYDLIASFEEIDDEEIQKMIQKFGDKYNDTKLELDLVQSTEEEEMHMF